MISLSEPNMCVVLFGGYDGTRYYNDVHVLDVANFVWKKVNATGAN
jgi:hypothetical protein